MQVYAHLLSGAESAQPVLPVTVTDWQLERKVNGYGEIGVHFGARLWQQQQQQQCGHTASAVRQLMWLSHPVMHSMHTQ
jgi:hypothetical protein